MTGSSKRLSSVLLQTCEGMTPSVAFSVSDPVDICLVSGRPLQGVGWCCGGVPLTSLELAEDCSCFARKLFETANCPASSLIGKTIFLARSHILHAIFYMHKPLASKNAVVLNLAYDLSQLLGQSFWKRATAAMSRMDVCHALSWPLQSGGGPVWKLCGRSPPFFSFSGGFEVCL